MMEYIVLSILFAYFIDLIVGDPYWFPHPVIYMGKYIAFAEEKIRRINASNRQMFFFGALIWISLVLISYFITVSILKIFNFNIFGQIAINSVIIAICFSSKCLAKEAKKVYQSLEESNLDEARKNLSFIVGRETETLSEEEIIRATVETVAENSVDGTMSPMFYVFLGKAPMGMVYKAVNTMDSMLGYRNKKYEYIGKIPAIMDDIFNYIPARLSIISISLASLFLNLDAVQSLKIAIRDRKNHKSPNCAYAEGAYAGALGVQLGGSNIYFGEKVYKPTIGDKKRELENKDILNSIRLLYISTFICFLIYTAIYTLIIFTIIN